MTKLLVPMDFSDVAFFGADAAVHIAPRLGAEVHFFSSVVGPAEGHYYIDDPDNDDDTPAGLHEQFVALRSRYADSGVSIVTAYSGEELKNGVPHYVKAENVGLVVMGSSGADGLKEFFFGSHAQQMASRLPCPVLVIKHPLSNYDFRTVVFASDFLKEARKPFQHLVELMKPFNAHIHLIHVITPEADKVEEFLANKKMHEFAAMAPGMQVTTHFSGDVDIEGGIIHYANEHRADLIGVVTHGETFWKKLFKGGSVSESILNHAEQPIITFNAHME